MRVAYFADAPRIGGAERYLADVVAGTIAAGHEVAVLSPQPEVLDLVPDARRLRVGSDAYASAPSMAARAAAIARSGPALTRALRSVGPDLVHVNNGGYPGSDLCRAVVPLAAGAGVPARAMSVHSVPWPREHSDERVQAAVDGALWRSAHALIGATNAVRHGLVDERAMPESLYVKIPYGVREPGGRDRAAALRERLAPGGELLLGMVSGTADAEKGHTVLVEALAHAGGDARAVFVGAHPGDLVERLIADRGLGDRVTIAGRVPEVGPYLHAIDALVVPSTAYESLPLTILEAMGAGRAVIASRLSGIPEAVTDGDTGCLFEPGDVEALGDLIEGAAGNRHGLRAMGERGRARWEERFSLSAMTRSVLALYERLTR
ncbi:MAG: hypothetical protein QOJ07_1507 [Thermoleophilaceae bacterium]|nr:hypothetical protein [Thermoleophilaceae bacterium]